MALTVWVLALALCAMVISRTKLATDMSAFLPRHPTPAQAVLVDQLHDGIVSRLMLLGIEGAPADKLDALSQRLGDDLAAQQAFVSVANGQPRDLAADRAYVWNHRYLLSPRIGADSFTPEALGAALARDLGLLAGNAGTLVKRTLPGDPTGETLALADNFTGQAHPVLRNGVWASPDGARDLLLVETRAAGFDVDGQQAALTALETAFDAARIAVDAPTARLLATGPGVFSVHARDSMKRDASRFSMIATLGVAALLLAVYRQPAGLLLGLLPVASGVAAGMAAVSATYGFVHGITLGFGVTLIGEAVDYAVYLFTQSSADSAPHTTIRRIWPTLRLGVATSVLGFGAMLLSGFVGFAQLGLFTVVGLLTAVAVTRFVLPGLMPRSLVAHGAHTLATPLRLIAGAARPLSVLIVVGVLASLAVIAGRHGRLWEDELSSMNPVPRSEQDLDRRLRAEIGAPDVRYMVVVNRPGDADTVLEASEALGPVLRGLQERHAIGGYDAPDEYLPSRAAQRARQSALPLQAVLAASMARATSNSPFAADTFAPFLADVESERTAPPLTRADLEGTDLALKLDSLVTRRGADEGGGWSAVLPLRDVRDAGAVKTALDGAGVEGVSLLDLKHESDALLTHYRREALILAGTGSLAIAGLLFAALRSVRRGLLVLMPLAGAVTLTTGILALGGKLSIFNLFGLLLVVAVGSNYCLFLETEGSDGDVERVRASLVVANLCTALGFGILALSGVGVLRGIGGTVAIGTVLSLLCGTVMIRPASRQSA